MYNIQSASEFTSEQTHANISNPETASLRVVFYKYASQELQGERFMTPIDLWTSYLHMFDEENHNINSLRVLARVVNTSIDGLISFQEFQSFERLLCNPNALQCILCRLFDPLSTGTVSFEMFKEVYSATTGHQEIEFDFDCRFLDLYFGENRKRDLSYSEFIQMMRIVHEEHIRQAFQRHDPAMMGSVLVVDFALILVFLQGHFLTPFVRDNLMKAAIGDVKTRPRRIAFPQLQALVRLLHGMPRIRQAYLATTQGNTRVRLTKQEMLRAAQQFDRVSPLQIDILFRFAGLQRRDGRITLREIDKMTHPECVQQMTDSENSSQRPEGMLGGLVSSMHRFALGSVSGACGATAVYPIDLVKTRIQNQRSGRMVGTRTVGEVAYRHSWDCFIKVHKFEGVFGLYRGLLPLIMGVAPERAIKLTTNDAVKDLCKDNQSGKLALWAEVFAGGMAGASQVILTNPLEIVKIRLQVAGQIQQGKRGLSALSVARELGFFGLYKGAPACFLRDIPFSAIYFPVYAHLKTVFADQDASEGQPNSPMTLLAAATLAGVPAASLVTPADVIKTRLQVVAREGQTSYSGVADAARKIWREEGARAFWKGTPARVFRSSPQFGVTLLTYELLQRGLPLPWNEGPTGTRRHQQNTEDLLGGYRQIHTTITGLETRFGLVFPKHSVRGTETAASLS